jgi:carbohydrate diacid regulator
MVLTDEDGIADFAEMLAAIFSSELSPDAAENIVLIDRNTLCAIVGRSGDIAPADAEELAAATLDTSREMGREGLYIGIGEPRRTLHALHESFEEARSAIAMGRLFGSKSHIFPYKRMMVERMLGGVPDELSRSCRAMLFNRRNNRILNEEMLRTVGVFMECSLNLSEAARLLFIHRNTLVYRLDKLQAATGLDLRRFDDAAAFRMMMLLGAKLGGPREFSLE